MLWHMLRFTSTGSAVSTETLSWSYLPLNRRIGTDFRRTHANRKLLCCVDIKNSMSLIFVSVSTGQQIVYGQEVP